MDNKNILELKIPPPIIFSISAGLMWLVSAALPSAGFALPAKNLIAAGIAAAGGMLAVPALISFLRAGTTMHPENPGKTTKLVVTGVYAITRNPMYLSLLLVLIGWGVYLSTAAAFVLVPFFVAYLNRFQIIPEEKALRSLFGREFEEYCERVRRWL